MLECEKTRMGINGCYSKRYRGIDDELFNYRIEKIEEVINM